MPFNTWHNPANKKSGISELGYVSFQSLDCIGGFDGYHVGYPGQNPQWSDDRSDYRWDRGALTDYTVEDHLQSDASVQNEQPKRIYVAKTTIVS